MTLDTFRATFLATLRNGRIPLAPTVTGETFGGCNREEIELAFTWAHYSFAQCYADNDGEGMDSFRIVLDAIRSANRRQGGRALRIR